MKKIFGPSWKTSLLGTGGILYTLADVIKVLVDNDPATTVNWGVTIGVLLPSIAALFARDNNVSSEEVKDSK